MVHGPGAKVTPDLLSPDQAQALSPIALAYIGDAVYELFVRRSFLLPPKRIQAYHRQVVHQVRAEQQSRCLDQLLPCLTPHEQDILRRGRNASPRGPKRLEGATYQRATGFEALIGYLYLTDPPRLGDLLNQISFFPEDG
ncbi:MAG: ribonuclease III domain-containing protein [Cyanobacteriota bacterium]|nr:ribonuclease III domain-containing protein [Cyanobacteriota bacterium]